MNTRQIVKEVARLSHESDERARAVVDSVLRTLGERLPAEAAEPMARRLPPELSIHLRQRVEAERFGREAFDERVAHRAGLAREDAVVYARWVLLVLGEGLGHDAVAPAAEALPTEFEPLFPEAPEASHGDVPALDPARTSRVNRELASTRREPRALGQVGANPRELARTGKNPRALSEAGRNPDSLVEQGDEDEPS